MLVTKHQIGQGYKGYHYNPAIGFLCGKECRCKNDCDAKFPKGTTERNMCRNWCKAQKPAIDKAPDASFFTVTQQQIAESAQAKAANKDLAKSIVSTVVSTGAGVAQAYLGAQVPGGIAMPAPTQQNQSVQPINPTPTPLVEEESWFKKNKTTLFVTTGIVTVFTAAVILSKKN